MKNHEYLTNSHPKLVRIEHRNVFVHMYCISIFIYLYGMELEACTGVQCTVYRVPCSVWTIHLWMMRQHRRKIVRLQYALCVVTQMCFDHIFWFIALHLYEFVSLIYFEVISVFCVQCTINDYTAHIHNIKDKYSDKNSWVCMTDQKRVRMWREPKSKIRNNIRFDYY